MFKLVLCHGLLASTLYADLNDVCREGAEDCKDTPEVQVPLIVVEEHHHVVDHWFSIPGVQEASPLNATLVHIDAHPDFGLPLNHDLIAPWPSDLNKLRENLENDQFIFMAMRWGMIGKIINIYPPFANMYIQDKNEIQTKYIELGMHTSGQSYCECERRCRSCELQCARTDTEIYVNPKQCKLEYSTEVISMSIWYAKSKGFGQFISATQPLILDIDEDFFAVESPFPKLVRASAQAEETSKAWQRGNVLEALQTWLKGKFCAKPPRVVEREQAVDTFFRGVVSIVLAVKELRKETEDFTRHLIGNFADEHSATLLGSVADALCEPTGNPVQDTETSIRLAQDFAWKLMRKFPVQSLRDIVEYGFCIDCDEVPRAGYLLWICMGASTKHDMRPDVHRLDLHTPTEDEVKLNMAELRSVVVSQLPVLPAMITVCRSLRDAYIPRNLWPGIERGVLELASATAESLGRNASTSYDRDCYWGAAGTPSRSKLPVREFLQQHGFDTMVGT